MAPHIVTGALVHYRYMSYPPGIILAVDLSSKRLLLDVDYFSETFCKWVHFSSVAPPLINHQQLPHTEHLRSVCESY